MKTKNQLHRGTPARSNPHLAPGVSFLAAVPMGLFALGGVGLTVGGCLAGKATGVEASREERTEFQAGTPNVSGEDNTVFNFTLVAGWGSAVTLGGVAAAFALRNRKHRRSVDALIEGIETREDRAGVKRYMEYHLDPEVRQCVAHRVRKRNGKQ